ncbi:MAG: D-Ala-D-Ala carboxypeptidase family metallohydrolase [Roseovarius confluentis]|jgi:zinc D-Ala-D-Ala carboxypeptidase
MASNLARHMGRQVIRAAHHSKVRPWRWDNFSPSELASKGDGSLMIDVEALDRLQSLRARLGRPMLVTSAYRDPAHNRRVGGAKSSYHMRGMAFDIRMDNHDPAAFEEAARAEGFTGFGYYPSQGFMHIDIGPERSWGKPFPARASRFAPEPKPARVTQGAKEGGSVAAVAVAAERVVNEAAPILPDHLVTWGFTGVAVLGLAIVLWRVLKAGAE